MKPEDKIRIAIGVFLFIILVLTSFNSGKKYGALKHFKGDITCQYTIDKEVYCFTKKDVK